MAKVKVKSLTKRYGAVTALDGVTLDADIFVVLGVAGLGHGFLLASDVRKRDQRL